MSAEVRLVQNMIAKVRGSSEARRRSGTGQAPDRDPRCAQGSDGIPAVPARTGEPARGRIANQLI
jgi:hypothetical protein